jgi:GTP-binding protein EngB required for normal cell division
MQSWKSDNRLEQHAAVLPKSPASDQVQNWLAPVLAQSSALYDEARTVVFFGMFKAGKSTLINAILGRSILPMKANRATGVITRLVYADQPTAKVNYFPNGRAAHTEIIPVEHAQPYILLDTSDTIAVPPKDVDKVTIGLPIPVLRTCTLVDTPGIMDNQALTERSLVEIRRADLAVMVLSADKLLSETERALALEVCDTLGGNVVFLVNRFDVVRKSHRAEVREWASVSLRHVKLNQLDYSKLYMVEAARHLDFKEQTEEAESACAELTDFETWLNNVFDTSTGCQVFLTSRLARLRSHIKVAKQVVEEKYAENQQKLEATRKQESAELEEKYRVLEQQVMDGQVRMEEFRSSVHKLCEQFVSNCVSDGADLIDDDKKWTMHMQDTFRNCTQRFADEVQQSTTSPLLQSYRVEPCLFAIEPEAIRVKMTNPLGDRMLGTLAKGTIRSRRINRIEAEARNFVPLLEERALQHIEMVKKALWDLKANYQPSSEFTPQVRDMETRAGEWQALSHWINEHADRVDTSERETCSQWFAFKVQWEQYCEDVFDRLVTIIEKKKQINGSHVNAIIQQEAERWQDPIRFNSHWLTQFAQKYPQKASVIQSQLENVTMVKPPIYRLQIPWAQLIVALGLVALLPILLLAFNINFPNHLAIIAGLLLYLPIFFYWWGRDRKRTLDSFISYMEEHVDSIEAQLKIIMEDC